MEEDLDVEKETMTSQDIYCEDDCEYPYKVRVDKIKAGDDHVDFIYQFAKRSKNTLIEYKNTCCSNDPSQILVGPPTQFPVFGESFPKALVVKTCNYQISTSLWHQHESKPRVESRNNSYIYYNYIDFEFEETVYPIRVSIYEVYYPGNVTQIWAQDQDFNDRWCLLWNGWIPTILASSQLFSPPLKSCDFKTKMIRIKFMDRLCDYNTQLDAVMLIGTSKLILPKNPQQTLTLLLKNTNYIKSKYGFYQDNSTRDYENAHSDILNLQEKFSEYCIIYKSDIAKSFHNNKLGIKGVPQEKDVPPSEDENTNNHLLRGYSKYPKLENIKFSLDESKEQPRCSFSKLPGEIILRILKHLDISSLYCVSRVNKQLNNLTRDPFLFTCLNIRNMRNVSSILIDNIMSYFASRCNGLIQLDLQYSDISVSHIKNFLDICGSRLTHLRLSSCKFVNKSVLLKISRICKKLKVLDLSYLCVRYAEGRGYVCFENLQFLEDLNLGGTHVTTKSVCKILKKNPRIRYLYLNDNKYRKPQYVNTIIEQLKNSCPNLEILNIKNCRVSQRGLDALIACKNLRKLDLASFIRVGDSQTDIRQMLFSSCERLEEFNSMSRTEWEFQINAIET